MAIFRLPDPKPDLKFDLGSGLGKHHASSIDVRSSETLRTCGCAWLWIRCRGRQARRQQIGDLELVRLRKRIPGKANAQHRRIENAFLGGGDRRSDLGGEQAAKSRKTNCGEPKYSDQSRPPTQSRTRSINLNFVLRTTGDEFRGSMPWILVNASAQISIAGLMFR
jgi:hypothetical protein